MFELTDIPRLLMSALIILPIVMLIRESGYYLIATLLGSTYKKLTIGCGPVLLQRPTLEVRKYFFIIAFPYPKDKVSRSERYKKRIAIPQRQGILLREVQEARCYTPKAGYLAPRGTRSALLYPKGRVAHSERYKKRVPIPQKQGSSHRKVQKERSHTPKARYLAPRGTKSAFPYPKSRVVNEQSLPTHNQSDFTEHLKKARAKSRAFFIAFIQMPLPFPPPCGKTIAVRRRRAFSPLEYSGETGGLQSTETRSLTSSDGCKR
ncbi:hypothetical protein SAMN04488123_10725 [Natribacillus halophilus]|uniref:Uncharacterized protein n=1 Tax=Natribacillus halophilus TaxID=549003 RepID=A0A1G8NTQ0_9BACI|nr:hypothetical protein SAMN04488123_10725 [Natribacillus halophilus]